MAAVVSDREAIFAERGFTWKVETSGLSIAALDSFKIGFVTPPNKEIIVLTRDYATSVGGVLASLHKNLFTGGTLARNLNLRLSYTGPTLMDIYESVTSTATLGPIITSARILAATSAGNANVSLPGDLKPVILAEDTSYIVNLQNIGANLGDMGLAFYYRERFTLPTFNEAP